MNNEVFLIVASILQAAQANNLTVSGGLKYKVPSGVFSIDKTILSTIGAAPAANLTSYALVAISGADDFSGDGVTIKNLFDEMVSITRTITPSCKFLHSLPASCLSGLLTRPEHKSELSGLLGTYKGICFLRTAF